MKNLSLMLSLVLTFTSAKIHARELLPKIINSNIKDTYKAAIELKGGGSICTGSVVGLNPPTVITARHCTDAGVKNFNYHWSPVKIYQNTFSDFSFIPSVGALPGDMVVLVFSKDSKGDFERLMKEEDLFIISPKTTLSPFQDVLFCGYGSIARTYSNTHGHGTQRCGTNKIILQDKSLDFSSEFNPDVHYKQDELTPEKQVNYMHSLLQTFMGRYGADTNFGAAALVYDSNPVKGVVDDKASMPLVAPGDSGGPMFIKTPEGNVLMGVNSYAMFWADHNIFGGGFWNVNHSWSQDLLKKAIEGGADIRGLSVRKNVSFTVEANVKSGTKGHLPGSNIDMSLVVMRKAGEFSDKGYRLRILDASNNVSVLKNELELGSIEGAPLFISQIANIKPTALPGSNFKIVGEVVYNNETVDFKLEGRVSDITNDISFTFPEKFKAGTLFYKKLGVRFTANYDFSEVEVSVSEVNSSFMKFKERSFLIKPLSERKEVSLELEYKISSEAVNRDIELRVEIKHQSNVIITKTIRLTPR